METYNSVSITAQIPQNTVTIYGYTSPSSRVELGSSKAYAVTYSDPDGYFIFDHLILPKHPLDFCLTATDDSLRQTQALCLPEPPAYNSYTEIGPVLLPPTLSLDLQNKYSSGQSIPNSTIQVYLYQQSSPIKLARVAQAFSLPVIEAKTDANGNYSLSIPNTAPTNYRLFSVVNYLDSNSPKSNTLLYQPQLSYSLLYLLLSLFLVIIALVTFFRLKRRSHYLPAIYYNKTISLLK